MKMVTRLFFILLMVKWNSVKALNILGVFPNQEQSHWFMYEKYLQYLAKKGHNLTVITHFPQEEVIPNYYDVDLGAKNKVTEEVFATKKTYWMTLKVMDYVVTSGIERCKEMLENESVQELWKSKRKFDLVVMDYFNGDCGLALAYKLGAPVIGVTSELFPWHYRTFGIPFNPSYVPFTFIDSFKPTLYKRVESTVLDYIFNLKYENAQREHEHILSKYFGDLPPLKELIRGIKFLLLYQNFVLSGSRLLPPNVIEVGGYHEMPTKPLPAHLLQYINESHYGVIYINFGPMVQESSLPKHIMDAILDTLPELPQRVIWKWNADVLPGSSRNIYFSKRLEQNDLLAHPKVLAFFSSGDVLSVAEAIHHGVPMIFLPEFNDQPTNTAAVEESGLGVQIRISDLTKDNLVKKFKIVLDSNFRTRVKILSSAYDDRPLSAMSSAIFWTEFAAQHNVSARHPAADVPLHQYLCLDVFAVIGTFIGITAICVMMLLRLVRIIFIVIRKSGNEKIKTE